MSVINQMLRDLDKRQAPDAAQLRQPVVAAKSSSRWLWGLWLLPALWLGVHFSTELSAELSAQLPRLFAAPSAAPSPATAGTPAEASQPVAAMVSPEPATAQAASTPAPSPAAVAALPATTKLPTPEAAEKVAIPDEVAATASLAAAMTAEDDVVTEPAEADIAEADPAEAYALASAPDSFMTEPASVAVPPQMQVTVADPAQAEPRHLQAKALQAQASGQWREAESAWLQLIQLRPHEPGAYEALAQLYLQQQQPARLSQLLLQAQQQQVESGQLQWIQVQALAASQQWAALLQALTPALQQQYPQPALALEAHAAQQLGQTERALQAYQRWTLLAPQDSRAWLGLAVQHEQSGHWPQARQAYQQALQLGGLTDASRQFIQQRLAQNPQS